MERLVQCVSCSYAQLLWGCAYSRFLHKVGIKMCLPRSRVRLCTSTVFTASRSSSCDEG